MRDGSVTTIDHRAGDDSEVRPLGRRRGSPRIGKRFRQTLVSLVMAVAVPLGVAAVGVGSTANAAFDPTAQDFWVGSSMGDIKSRVWRAADGNTSRVVYLLDGLRARPDLNGWEIETNVAPELAKWNINVVMPVGGQSSFYSDWYAPSNFNGQKTTYKWETFLTDNLRYALRDRLGFKSTGNGVVGLSMGGSAALTLSAYHPDQFRYAGSLSGYLNISAPGMREAIRVAMLDSGGYNVDSMWGPPWNPAWLRNDPFVFAPRLRDNGTRLWISAGSGLPGPFDRPMAPIDYYNTGNAMGLEAIALANTRAFQIRMATLNANRNVTYSFPPVGTHSWGYWQDEVFKLIPDLSANIG